MKLTLSFETPSFSRDLNQLRVLLKKDGRDIVLSEGKLFLRDAMKLTPPCGRHAITESWAEQRRIGMAAVERQIRRLFPNLAEVNIIKNHPRAQEYFRRYIRSGGKEAARKMLADFGISGVPIFNEATKDLHTGARNSKGRVRKGARVLVMDYRSVDKLVRYEQTQVGKGKAGFMKAATALGLSVPNWISRHSSSPGHWIDNTKNTFSPSIVIGNLLGYIQEPGARIGVMHAAMKNRRRSIRIRIEKLIKHYRRR